MFSKVLGFISQITEKTRKNLLIKKKRKVEILVVQGVVVLVK